VKALFRRGQARIGLGCLDKARAGECNIFHAEIMKNINIRLIDFVRASELEPSNQSVKQELSEVDKLIQQQKQKHDSAVGTANITICDS
jgi:hypothetical protein